MLVMKAGKGIFGIGYDSAKGFGEISPNYIMYQSIE